MYALVFMSVCACVFKCYENREKIEQLEINSETGEILTYMCDM